MSYSLDLKWVGMFCGLILILVHVMALANTRPFQEFLRALPRSYGAGAALLTIDWLWTEALVIKMDWGEFYYLRTPIACLLPVCFFLALKYVDDFLSARALGILALLGAAPLLDAAFLRPVASRLLVVILAYVWVILGMLWVGQPHLLRDQIAWVQKSALRWKIAGGAGLAYGIVLLLCAMAFY